MFTQNWEDTLKDQSSNFVSEQCPEAKDMISESAKVEERMTSEEIDHMEREIEKKRSDEKKKTSRYELNKYIAEKNKKKFAQPTTWEIEISADILYRALQVYHCASTDETRPHLMQIRFEFYESTLKTIATDGHKLVIFEHKLDIQDCNVERIESFIGFSIDSKTAKDISSQIKKIRQLWVVIRRENGDYTFSFPGTAISTSNSDENNEFPPYEKVIPNPDIDGGLIDRRMETDCIGLGILQLE